MWFRSTREFNHHASHRPLSTHTSSAVAADAGQGGRRAAMNGHPQQLSPVTESATGAANFTLQRTCDCGDHATSEGWCDACKSHEGALQRNPRHDAEPQAIFDSAPDHSHSSGRAPTDAAAFPSESQIGADFSRIPARPPAASILRKPLISTPGDRYEREADDVADKVMRMAEPTTINAASPAIQRRCTDCEEQEEKLIQTARMPSAHSEEGLDASVAAGAVRRGGTPLSPDLRAYFEPRFGHDFSQVRIHTDAEGSKAARSVQARAYTYGSDIVFGPGEYAPATTQGRRLLAHELTHVI